MAKVNDTDIGMDMESGEGRFNRTGIMGAPDMALDLIREAQRTPPSSKGDARKLAEYRGSYLEEGAVLGSLPSPADAGPEAPAEDDPVALLMDKLGERLAFERQGVRLYQALAGKVELMPESLLGPSVEDLEHILGEEKEHFRLLQQAIMEAGGDPTVQTPSADVAGVLSQGICHIVVDPRTSLAQCLQAILQAELADNDGWELLIGLAETQGRMELATSFGQARENEREHLEKVWGWLAMHVLGKEPAAPAPAKAGEKAGLGKVRTKGSGTGSARTPAPERPPKASGPMAAPGRKPATKAAARPKPQARGQAKDPKSKAAGSQAPAGKGSKGRKGAAKRSRK